MRMRRSGLCFFFWILRIKALPAKWIGLQRCLNTFGDESRSLQFSVRTHCGKSANRSRAGTPAACTIDWSPDDLSGVGRVTSRYQLRKIEPLDLRDTSRLASLFRAGQLYVSVRDAIALAI